MALLFSVMLHEAGHFFTAKRFGMKATQFFVGFGPTLWSLRKGETEYGVKAIPAGGFVKIVGMTELEEVDPADEPRAFCRQPGWQRTIVLAAGSFMHFVLAFVLLFALAVGIGLASAGTSTTVGAIDTCVPSSLTAVCKASNPASPAKKAASAPGDKIIAVDGEPVHNWTQMGKAIRSQPGAPVAVTVQRGGKQADPDRRAWPSSTAARGRTWASRRSSCSSGPGRSGAVTYAGGKFGQILAGSAGVVASLPKAIPDLFAKNRGSSPGGQVTSVVGAADVTGQVVAAPIGWQARVAVVHADRRLAEPLRRRCSTCCRCCRWTAATSRSSIYERCRAWLARLRGEARSRPGGLPAAGTR